MGTRVAPLDAVVLLPGFLGLGRIGRFYYFSERIAAALHASLQASCGRNVLVVPSYTRPIGSLRARQAYLLDQLALICERVPSLERLHLVGHSAGGVDAQLLACDRPIAVSSWEPFAPVRAKIASVVAISAPQHGTFLARAEAVRLLAGRLSLTGALGLGRMTVDLVRLLSRQPAVGDILAGARTQFPEAASFLVHLVRHRELLEDLEPAAMAALRKHIKPDPRIPLTSFVTMAALRTDARVPPDPFFRDLWELTASHAHAEEGTLAAALERLRAARPGLTSTPMPEVIDEKTSDGVVTSGLQLLDPGDPDELGGVVVADHADVIGHYDRTAGLLERRGLQTGMFHSGSGFDDDGFFALYQGVAAAICRAMPESRSTAASDLTAAVG